MLKKPKSERPRRWSLLLPFTRIVLVILVITTLIVGVAVYFLISYGMLKPGDTKINLWLLLFFIVSASFLIGALLSFLTLRYPLKPVDKVLNALNRLASGDYSVRLQFRGPIANRPPLAELTESFNKMAEELQRTELLRTDFVNNFSHEFKTPIVSITGFAKLLRRGNLTEERKAECLDIIEEESLRLSRMATNVLNLSKVENQSILTDVESLNLTEQIRTSVLMLERKWEKKALSLQLPEEEVYLKGNRALLEQVWINLLDNAIKYSPEGGEVSVLIVRGEGETLVTVANQGEPIPPDRLDRIFDKFYQADESHAAEGNGIGLAVVKRIVDLHGGVVSVHCEGGITSFRVVLPDLAEEDSF